MEEYDPSDDSNRPSDADEADDLSGDDAGDDAGASTDSTKDTTGNQKDFDLSKVPTHELEAYAQGRLRRYVGEDRKRFLAELAVHAPARLEAMLSEDEDLRTIAAKHGITPESLRSPKTSAAAEVPEAFIANALEKNLDRRQAEQAWQLAIKLGQGGIAAELAQKTALEQTVSHPETPPGIPAGGSPAAAAAAAVTEMVSHKVFTEWDYQQRNAYEAKFGRKFTD